MTADREGKLKKSLNRPGEREGSREPRAKKKGRKQEKGKKGLETEKSSGQEGIKSTTTT